MRIFLFSQKRNNNESVIFVFYYFDSMIIHISDGKQDQQYIINNDTCIKDLKQQIIVCLFCIDNIM